MVCTYNQCYYESYGPRIASNQGKTLVKCIDVIISCVDDRVLVDRVTVEAISRVQLNVCVLSVTVKFTSVKTVVVTACVKEIEKRQVNEFILIERNGILDNIVIVVLGQIRIEVDFYPILTQITHQPSFLVFYGNEIVSDELMGNTTFIDVFVDSCVVCLTVRVKLSFCLCCNIAEVNDKVQVLSNSVGERIVIKCDLF